MGVKYSDLPRTSTVHMDDRVAVLSSTDDILKTVPAGSLGGVFVGTSAQWAALTAEQKAQYDQKQVILTDGEGGGFNPVEITYADWIALPPAQRNSGTWLVTGFPVATNADLIPYTGDVEAANVGAAINALNQNLTYRWNPTTDYFEHYKNGQWIQDKFAGFNGIFYMKNGTVSTIAQGASTYPYGTNGLTGYTKKNISATKNGNYMVLNDVGGANTGIYAFSAPIDFQEISQIKMTWNGVKDSGGFTMDAYLQVISPLGDNYTDHADVDLFGGTATSVSETTVTLNVPNTATTGYIAITLRSYLGSITVNIKDIELVPR